MTKPAKIPQEEIARAIRAAKKAGWTEVRVEMNGLAVEIRLGEGHIGSMSKGHLPAPEASEEPGKGRNLWVR